MAKGSVRVEVGLTTNLGNYESLRISVTLEEEYTGEPGSERDTVYAALLDDVRVKLYEAIAEETKNFREISSGFVAA